MGHFIFSLIGFKRVMFRNIFQRGLRAILGFYILENAGAFGPGAAQSEEPPGPSEGGFRV